MLMVNMQANTRCVTPQPSDQIDLDRWPRLLLKGGGGRIHEVEANWPQGPGGHPSLRGGCPCVAAK